MQVQVFVRTGRNGHKLVKRQPVTTPKTVISLTGQKRIIRDEPAFDRRLAPSFGSVDQRPHRRRKI